MGSRSWRKGSVVTTGPGWRWRGVLGWSLYLFTGIQKDTGSSRREGPDPQTVVAGQEWGQVGWLGDPPQGWCERKQLFPEPPKGEGEVAQARTCQTEEGATSMGEET